MPCPTWLRLLQMACCKSAPCLLMHPCTAVMRRKCVQRRWHWQMVPWVGLQSMAQAQPQTLLQAVFQSMLPDVRTGMIMFGKLPLDWRGRSGVVNRIHRDHHFTPYGTCQPRA